MAKINLGKIKTKNKEKERERIKKSLRFNQKAREEKDNITNKI